MWHKYVEPVLQWLYRVIREPRSELNRWQQTVRFGYDLGKYGARQLREDRAPQMAAALAYQALFALVPVLIVATIIVRALMSDQEVYNLVDQGIAAVGLFEETDAVIEEQDLDVEETDAEVESGPAPDDAQIELNPELDEAQVDSLAAGENESEPGLPPETPAESSEELDRTKARAELKAWLTGLIDKAAQFNLTTVGWIGFGVIIYAAINMLVTIENSFNVIFRAPGGRPWTRRIPLYWSLLTLGPLALVLTALLNENVATLLTELAWHPLFVRFGTLAWRISVGWLFWFAIYVLVPNTSVNLKAAAIGALAAVVLLEAGKAGLGVYLTSIENNVVYASLGLIPLFMFWVHLMWLVILFGLEVSATLQFLGDHAIEEMESRRESAGLIEPSIVVSTMQVVGQGFESGQPTPQQIIADRVGVSEKLVAPIVQELCRAGYLHRVEGENKSVCLSRPPDQIQAAELMDVGFQLADSSRESTLSTFANRLREAQRERAANVALGAIIPKTLIGDSTNASA